MSNLAWWQTLVSGAAGGAITLAGQWLRGRQEVGARVTALHEERSLAKADRREAFELEVLVELRTALGVLIDEAYEMREAGDAAERQYGDASIVWEDGGQPYQEAWSGVRRGSLSVLDDPVRARIEAFLEQVKTFATGADTWGAFLDHTDEVYETLGRRIRAMYGADEEAKYRRGITEPKAGAR